MLKDAGISCAMVMDANNNRVFYDGESCTLQDELEILTRQTIQSGEKSTRYFGSTWGVYWKQNKNLIVSAPLLQRGRCYWQGPVLFCPLKESTRF